MIKPISKFSGKKGKSSGLIQFVWTKKTANLINDMIKKWPNRIIEARQYFMLDVGSYFRGELLKSNPSVKFKDGKWEYAKDLRIGILEESKDKDVIAIYSHSMKETITDKNKMETVLYFRPGKESPSWVHVLIKYGPWPSYLLPVKVNSGDAISISRKARMDEVASLSGAIMSKKDQIEGELAAAGMIDPAIDSGDVAVGMDAIVDLGHGALRGELGFISGSQVGAWRSAMKDTKEYAGICMGKVAAYIVNGDKNVFDLPDESDIINKSIIRDGDGFAREIARFLK